MFLRCLVFSLVYFAFSVNVCYLIQVVLRFCLNPTPPHATSGAAELVAESTPLLVGRGVADGAAAAGSIIDGIGLLVHVMAMPQVPAKHSHVVTRNHTSSRVVTRSHA